MTTNGAFRIEIYYSPYFKKYKAVPKQFYQEDPLDTGKLFSRILVVAPWWSFNSVETRGIRYFKTLKKAHTYADKVANMGTKYLEKEFADSEEWNHIPLASLPYNKKYYLTLEEVQELESQE